MRACKTKTTTNKSKMTKNDCDGIMGKSKQVEQKLKVSKTGHACITFRNFLYPNSEFLGSILRTNVSGKISLLFNILIFNGLNQ